ncbi:phenylethanolamine N-methyltransferase-like [Pollicipes pollicipes]|uniref:phenylethanolamine N-methyltransferase-like n=1 Tax=Pollicipes pollicipes TaxID=41117 RepID=UPI0018853F5A|nr:phenylethanolamine N-methyltransferase-like [Pollicipes pollicipes]
MGEVRELYARFDPVSYHRTYYAEVDAEMQFFLEQLHVIFAEGLPGCVGRHVLEVGCGPTITAVLSASRWSEHITMADFVPANREAVSAWLTEAEGHLDWTPHLRHVAALEGGGLTPGELAKRVRVKVEHVQPADVLSDQPLGETASNRYDVVVSSLCLEFASSDLDQYRRAVLAVSTLVKPGGYLIMQGALGNTFYQLDDVRFPSVSLTPGAVLEALTAADCSPVRLHEIPRLCPPSKMADHTGCFFVAARKMQKCDQ